MRAEAQGEDFKIETCLTAPQKTITGWVIVWKKDTKEKLGTKLTSEVSSKHKLMSNTCSRHEFNIFTSETLHGKSKAVLTPLTFTATKLPEDFGRTLHNLMHICDGKDCVDEKNGPDQAASHRKSAHKKQCVNHLVPSMDSSCTPGKKHITVCQFTKVRDTQYHGKSEIKNLSNSMFEHTATQTF